MEFYYKFMDRFQDISKVKNAAISKEKTSNNLEPSKANFCFRGGYDTLLASSS